MVYCLNANDLRLEGPVMFVNIFYPFVFRGRRTDYENLL
jgi:hypothetical protein